MNNSGVAFVSLNHIPPSSVHCFISNYLLPTPSFLFLLPNFLHAGGVERNENGRKGKIEGARDFLRVHFHFIKAIVM